jgi:hypothetical protein
MDAGRSFDPRLLAVFQQVVHDVHVMDSASTSRPNR